MDYSWKLDDFSTQVLGFKTVKIVNIESPDNVKDLLSDFAKNSIEYATYRVGANNFPLIHSLEKSGFVLVDGLISLDADISNMEIRERTNEIREASKNDLKELTDMTLGLYLISRIYNDPLIPKKKADNFYKKWVENSLSGKVADMVLVWYEKKLLGYITLQKKGQIPLIGVSREAQGRGIAKKLIKASFVKFKEWGVGVVKIETQMGNIPALRVDIDCGFKIVDSFLTFRWANQ